MSKNEIFSKGAHISLPVPPNTPGGTGVRLGILNGFTEAGEGEGVGTIPGYASWNFEGAFEVSVTGALSIGQAVYIQDDMSLTSEISGALFGASLTAKGAGEGLAIVKSAGITPAGSGTVPDTFTDTYVDTY